MRIALRFILLALLVMVQGSLLPLWIPQLYFYPALLLLVIYTFRLERAWVLGLALWTGLVADMLYGEGVGLFMLTHYVAIAAAWGVPRHMLDYPLVVLGLRLFAAIAVHELVQMFIMYVTGAGENLFQALRISSGLVLLANTALFALLFLYLRLRGDDSIRRLLEVER